MVSSKYGWSKIVLTGLLFNGLVGQYASAEGSYDPRAKKVSEIIKENDPRYLVTLATGASLTLAGIVVLLKSCWASKTVDDYKKACTLEDWERWRFHYGEDNIRGGSGFGYICIGLFIIANAKNIPAFYDILGEKAGAAFQAWLLNY